MADTDDSTKTDDDSSTDKDDKSKGTDTGTTSTDKDDDREEWDSARWKTHSRKHETENVQLRKQIEQLEEKHLSDTEKATKTAIREAEDRVRAEMLGEMVDTALAAAAKSKLADPSFVRLLDTDVRETFSSGGKVDSKAIDKALDGLVKAHPNLAPAGRAGGLPGGDKTSKSSGFDMNAEIRRRAGRG